MSPDALSRETKGKGVPPPHPEPPPEPAKATGAATPAVDSAAVQELVRSLGHVLSMASLYSVQHNVTRNSVEESYAILRVFFEKYGAASFHVSEGVLRVNNSPPVPPMPIISKLVKHLIELKVSMCILDPAMTQEEYHKLIDLLCTPAKQIIQMGSFAEAATSIGLEHMRVKTATYRAVSEDEVVLQKEAAEAAMAQRSAAEIDGQIIAFLRGGASANAETVNKDVQEASSDPARLASLILQASEVPPAQPNVKGGQRFVDLVVGSLRRSYETLLQDPSAKTQKGRKAVKKALLLLEREVIERLRAVNPDDKTNGMAEVSSAVEEMVDELEIESWADEYMKKRDALGASEKRILRFIRTASEERLRESGLGDRLLQNGLDADALQDLLDQGTADREAGPGPGTGPGVGPGGPGVGDFTHLAHLLKRLQDAGAKGPLEGTSGEPSSELNTVVQEIHRTVAAIAAGTEQKINAFVQAVKPPTLPSGEPGKQEPLMSRKKLIALLAEIVQELRQPIAVINCIIYILLQREVGALTEAQEEILRLAAEDSARLGKLSDRLLEISGVPLRLQPDKTIIDKLY